MSTFSLTLIRDLHRQLMLSPADVRGRYADRLERLLLELEPERAYPYEFVYFRIVGVRLGASSLETFTGLELLPDLVLLLERLSEGISLHASAAGETVYTINELRERLGVTARTIHRWRRRGLVSRKYIFPDGARRTGVRHSSLERFTAANEGAISSSGGFSRLTDEEEEEIVRRVTDYRREGLSTTAAAARVGGEVGRAQETIRLVLKRRQESPDARPTTLTAPERREMLAGYRRGVSARELARRADRSLASVYRILNQERAAELLSRPVRFVSGSEFGTADAEERDLGEGLDDLLGRLEAVARAAKGADRPGRSPLSREEERGLFRAYNHAKFLLARGLEELNPSRYVPTRHLRDLEKLSARAARIRDLLADLHKPLVERVVRQHTAGPVGESELMARGRALLGQLIESFDWTGRGRFAALVTLDLQKAFARLIAERTGGAAQDQ